MPKVKIPRKSTWVDMTAFVDVAFLILSFFILTTKFKPTEPVPITTPSSVSSKKIDDKTSITVLIDKTGKVFTLLPEDKPKNKELIENINSTRGLGLTPAEISKILKSRTIGVPFDQLKTYYSLSDEEAKKVNMPGIPTDSIGGELGLWVRDILTQNAGNENFKIYIKGDAKSKYPAFGNVLEAMKINNQYKFFLITDVEAVPGGTPYAKKLATDEANN